MITKVNMFKGNEIINLKNRDAEGGRGVHIGRSCAAVEMEGVNRSIGN